MDDVDEFDMVLEESDEEDLDLVNQPTKDTLVHGASSSKYSAHHDRPTTQSEYHAKAKTHGQTVETGGVPNVRRVHGSKRTSALSVTSGHTVSSDGSGESTKALSEPGKAGAGRSGTTVVRGGRTVQSRAKASTVCIHEFVSVRQSGRCVVCKQPIQQLRNPGYECVLCKAMVHHGCKATALGLEEDKEKSTKPIRYVFIEHMRIGQLRVVFNMRYKKINLVNVPITLNAQVIRDKMCTWGSVIKQTKSAYLKQLMKFGTATIIQRFVGLGNANRSVEEISAQTRKDLHDVGSDEEELDFEEMVKLLLGEQLS